jgi:hypothetical protein
MLQQHYNFIFSGAVNYNMEQKENIKSYNFEYLLVVSQRKMIRKLQNQMDPFYLRDKSWKFRKGSIYKQSMILISSF